MRCASHCGLQNRHDSDWKLLILNNEKVLSSTCSVCLLSVTALLVNPPPCFTQEQSFVFCVHRCRGCCLKWITVILQADQIHKFSMHNKYIEPSFMAYTRPCHGIALDSNEKLFMVTVKSISFFFFFCLSFYLTSMHIFKKYKINNIK